MQHDLDGPPQIFGWYDKLEQVVAHDPTRHHHSNLVDDLLCIHCNLAVFVPHDQSTTDFIDKIRDMNEMTTGFTLEQDLSLLKPEAVQ